jgi:hypothetical protein
MAGFYSDADSASGRIVSTESRGRQVRRRRPSRRPCDLDGQRTDRIRHEQHRRVARGDRGARVCTRHRSSPRRPANGFAPRRRAAQLPVAREAPGPQTIGIGSCAVGRTLAASRRSAVDAMDPSCAECASGCSSRRKQRSRGPEAVSAGGVRRDAATAESRRPRRQNRSTMATGFR